MIQRRTIALYNVSLKRYDQNITPPQTGKDPPYVTCDYCILHSGWSPAGLEAFSLGASGPRGFRCLAEGAGKEKKLVIIIFPEFRENMLKRFN